jgi:hypothetical protein
MPIADERKFVRGFNGNQRDKAGTSRRDVYRNSNPSPVLAASASGEAPRQDDPVLQKMNELREMLLSSKINNSITNDDDKARSKARAADTAARAREDRNERYEKMREVLGRAVAETDDRRRASQEASERQVARGKSLPYYQVSLCLFPSFNFQISLFELRFSCPFLCLRLVVAFFGSVGLVFSTFCALETGSVKRI